jgi:ABC-type lipoprotein release transport system permease subunit
MISGETIYVVHEVIEGGPSIMFLRHEITPLSRFKSKRELTHVWPCPASSCAACLMACLAPAIRSPGLEPIDAFGIGMM